MEIYKYRIWTGNIPGDYTSGCTDNPLITPVRQLPTNPFSLDCSPCESLGDSIAIMNACVDCWNGLVNVCCPTRNESCCGIVIDDCEQFYEMTAQQQQEYCTNCAASPISYQKIQDMMGPGMIIGPPNAVKSGQKGVRL